LKITFFLRSNTKGRKKDKQQRNNEAPQSGIARAARPGG